MSAKSLVAKKIGMSRAVDENGQMVAITVLQVVDQKITKLIDQEKHGYTAIQVGYHQKSEKNLTKADKGRLIKSEVEENFSKFMENRCSETELTEMVLGSSRSANLLDGLVTVDVTGTTKGRGFEGSITRWGHKTGRRTHGSHFHRRPGSLGQRTTPGRVYKNKGQPGQMGNVQRTAQNLKVFQIDEEAGMLAIQGSVPGCRGGYVIVKPSVKSKSA